MKVFAEGVESFVGDERNENPNDLIPNLSCDIGGSSSQVLGASRQQQESSWNLGETFHKYVTIFGLGPKMKILMLELKFFFVSM